MAASADFGAPGPIIDFQAPAAAHADRGQRAQEEAVREDVPGGTAAGQRRRHEQRRLLRRIADQLRRHDRRPAVQRLHRVDLAVSDDWPRRTSISRAGSSGRSRDTRRPRSSTGRLTAPIYDPAYSEFIDRDAAQATRTVRGGTALGIYPLSRYRRVQVSGGFVQLSEKYNDPGLQELAQEYQQQNYGQPLFRDGSMMPLGVEFVQETTVFREFGPLAGNTVRLAYDASPELRRACCRARPSTPICGTTCDSAPPACWRPA